jgi:hypothetical protein
MPSYNPQEPSLSIWLSLIQKLSSVRKRALGPVVRHSHHTSGNHTSGTAQYITMLCTGIPCGHHKESPLGGNDVSSVSLRQEVCCDNVSKTLTPSAPHLGTAPISVLSPWLWSKTLYHISAMFLLTGTSGTLHHLAAWPPVVHFVIYAPGIYIRFAASSGRPPARPKVRDANACLVQVPLDQKIF